MATGLNNSDINFSTGIHTSNSSYDIYDVFNSSYLRIHTGGDADLGKNTSYHMEYTVSAPMQQFTECQVPQQLYNAIVARFNQSIVSGSFLSSVKQIATSLLATSVKHAYNQLLQFMVMDIELIHVWVTSLGGSRPVVPPQATSSPSMHNGTAVNILKITMSADEQRTTVGVVVGVFLVAALSGGCYWRYRWLQQNRKAVKVKNQRPVRPFVSSASLPFIAFEGDQIEMAMNELFDAFEEEIQSRGSSPYKSPLRSVHKYEKQWLESDQDRVSAFSAFFFRRRKLDSTLVASSSTGCRASISTAVELELDALEQYRGFTVKDDVPMEVSPMMQQTLLRERAKVVDQSRGYGSP